MRNYDVIETDQRVGDGVPDFVSRFRFRAERFARKGNARRAFPSYRYEVVREHGRWAAVVMQNIARPLERHGKR